MEITNVSSEGRVPLASVGKSPCQPSKINPSFGLRETRKRVPFSKGSSKLTGCPFLVTTIFAPSTLLRPSSNSAMVSRYEGVLFCLILITPPTSSFLPLLYLSVSGVFSSTFTIILPTVAPLLLTSSLESHASSCPPVPSSVKVKGWSVVVFPSNSNSYSRPGMSSSSGSSSLLIRNFSVPFSSCTTDTTYFVSGA